MAPAGGGGAAVDPVAGDGGRRRIDRPPLLAGQPLRWRRLVVVVAVVAAMAVVAATLDLAVAWRRVERLDVATTGSSPGGTTYLLVGLDRRPTGDGGPAGAPDGARADVLVALRVPDAGPPEALTISRDLLVTGPDGVPDRLGPLWDRRPDELLGALCDELGLGVDHVLTVDLSGFDAMVDSVGGVDVVVPERLRDGWVGIDLAAGPTHLDGAAALDYVRARQGIVHVGGAWVREPDPTAARSRRATDVLDALAGEASGSWRSPLQAHRLLWAGTGALAADPGVGIGDVGRLGGAVRSLDDVDALPVEVTGAAVPVATLADGAEAALAEMGAGPTGCQSPPSRGA